MNKANLHQIHEGTSIYRQCDSSSFTGRIFNVSTFNTSLAFMITLWVRIPLKKNKYYATLLWMKSECVSHERQGKTIIQQRASFLKFDWTALLFLCEFCLITNFQSRLCKYRATKLRQCVFSRALKKSCINSDAATTTTKLSGSIIALTGFLSLSVLKWKHGVESSD